MFAFLVSSAAALAFGAPPADPPKITSVVLLAPGQEAPAPLMTPPVMTAPVAGGSLVDAFRPGDYPKDALASQKGGLVTVRAHLTVDGKIDRCDVLGSSGTPSLDVATCAAIRERARFRPARDHAGKPIDTVLEQGVAWAPSKPVPFAPPKLLSIVRAGPGPAPDASVPVPIGVGGQASPYGLISLFSSSDYPRDALLKGEQGTVVARVAVDATGEVSGCEVTDSSQSTALDTATCNVIRERAHFKPAHDSSGKAIAGQLVQRVRWVLPSGGAVVWKDFLLRQTFTIGPARTITACSTDPIQEPGLPPPPDCELSRARAQGILTAAPTDYRFAGQELVIENGSLKGGGADTLSVGQGKGEQLLSRWSTEVQFDGQGRPISCRTGKNDPVPDDVAKELCDMKIEEKDVPPEAKAVAPRTVAFYHAVYLRPAGRTAR